VTSQASRRLHPAGYFADAHDGSADPVLALAYLRELSADVRAGIVLDAQGNALASIGDGDRARRPAALPPRRGRCSPGRLSSGH
jgi:hypothetical protein